MTKILIAYDGSDCSEKALHDLRKAGMPDEAEAFVFTVADSWRDLFVSLDLSGGPSVTPPKELNPAELSSSEATEVSKKGAATLRGYFPNWTVHPESVSILPAMGVMARIESLKPDLVVMGSHGRSNVGRLLFGSVSHKVLTHAHCNLRISRGRDGKDSAYAPPRIVVAYDGSQESETAFVTVLCRKWPKGTAVKLITVIDTKVSLAFLRPTGPISYWVRQDDKDPQGWVKRMFIDQKRRLEDRGLIAQVEAIKGDPKRVLLKEAEEWGANMIFAGPRGLTGAKGIAGSVSTTLATHAHCTVEIVHRSWDSRVCCEKWQEEHRDCMAMSFNY
jgi:nucleotide-binding universal stress UspA family protein